MHNPKAKVWRRGTIQAMLEEVYLSATQSLKLVERKKLDQCVFKLLETSISQELENKQL